jgi:hypothetical protein
MRGKEKAGQQLRILQELVRPSAVRTEFLRRAGLHHEYGLKREAA